MTEEKGVYKGEFFPPCTEEEALSSSVGFCFLCFFAFEGYRGEAFSSPYTEEDAFSSSVSSLSFTFFAFIFIFLGGSVSPYSRVYKGALPPYSYIHLFCAIDSEKNVLSRVIYLIKQYLFDI